MPRSTKWPFSIGFSYPYFPCIHLLYVTYVMSGSSSRPDDFNVTCAVKIMQLPLT